MDILTLVIIIALIGIGNIGLLLWMKFGATSDTSVNINKSILKFQTSIDKTEKMIYDQLERNREERIGVELDRSYAAKIFNKFCQTLKFCQVFKR